MPSFAAPDAFTFVFINDLHLVGGDEKYGLTPPETYKDKSYIGSEDLYQDTKLTVAAINSLPTFQWPGQTSCAGQTIVPQAVFVNGDPTHGGGEYADFQQGDELVRFRNLYERGRTADAIVYPVFIGLGNHDLDIDASLLTDYYRNQMWAYVKSCHGPFDQTPLQPVTAIDLEKDVFDFYPIHNWTKYSYNYVVEHPGVAFFQLHRYGGDVLHGRAGGLTWLSQQLARIGHYKKIVICQHYGWDSFSTSTDPATPSWTSQQWEPLLAELDGYNVVGIFHGHIHTPVPYHYTYAGVPYDLFSPGSGLTSQVDDAPTTPYLQRFGVCRISSHALDIVFAEVDEQGKTSLVQPYTKRVDPWILDQEDTFLSPGAQTGMTGPGILAQCRSAVPEYPPLGLLQYNPAQAVLQVSLTIYTQIPAVGTALWEIAPTDRYYAIGDVNGDQQPEILVQSRYAGADRYLAVLAYDPAIPGLKILSADHNQIPVDLDMTPWSMDQTDTYYAAGDIDGNGRTEILVQSHTTDDPRHIALLAYDVSTGLLKVWGGREQIAGGWGMDPSDSYYAIGDINGDGKAEMLVQSHYAGQQRYLAMLGYDATTGGLKSFWADSNQIALLG